MQIHLFGASTSPGEAYRQIATRVEPSWPLYAYSRHSVHNVLDLRNPSTFKPAGNNAEPSIWISFAPIWLFAPFIAHLASESPGFLSGVSAIIACSSSSALTKRYAANSYDRQLVHTLTDAEANLSGACECLKIPCKILQPTLIYGQVGVYSDLNLSLLLKLLERLPLLPLPASTGLRQPIHARQLAEVAFSISKQFSLADSNPALPERIPVGGDVQLSYRDMIQALQSAQPPRHPARCCLLLPIPNRLFFFLAAPLLLRSPKAYEAVLRMGADLAGFVPSHTLLAKTPEPFPLPD